MNYESNTPTPETPETIAPRKKAWKIFGWAVIVFMISMIVLNLLQLVSPEVNQIALPACVVAYIIYVFFRRR